MPWMPEWDWYAAYHHARRSSLTPDEAAASADRYMAEVKPVMVVQPAGLGSRRQLA